MELDEKTAQEVAREARFNRRFRLLELKDRRDDRALKKLEIESSAGRGIRFTSAQATVAAALLALASAVAGGWMQSAMTRDVEANKNLALVEIERLRAEASINLEKQKQDFEERIKKAEFETSLIVKAIEAPKREDQIRNLKFFLNAGFIDDEDGKIAAIKESDLPSLAAGSAPTGDLPVIVSKILTTVGLPSNFSVQETAEIPNAAAMVKDGVPVLLINPSWISQIGGGWTTAFVLSHEIGHHLLGHLTLTVSKTPAASITLGQKELEADEFAGFVLGRMGASEEEATEAVSKLSNEVETEIYPGRAKRLVAVTAGWKKAREMHQQER